MEAQIHGRLEKVWDAHCIKCCDIYWYQLISANLTSISIQTYPSCLILDISRSYLRDTKGRTSKMHLTQVDEVQRNDTGDTFAASLVHAMVAGPMMSRIKICKTRPPTVATMAPSGTRLGSWAERNRALWYPHFIERLWEFQIRKFPSTIYE